jgi:small subunit ribosomal protein S1
MAVPFDPQVDLLDELARRHESGETIDGVIVEFVKGGAIVDIGVRAFLPKSKFLYQNASGKVMTTRRLGGPATVRFEVFEPHRDQIVVSETQASVFEGTSGRALAPWPDAAGVWPALVIASMLNGSFAVLPDRRVGFIHVSNMGWSATQTPADAAAPGKVVRVLVNQETAERLSLSMLIPGEGEYGAAAALVAGQRFSGVIRSVVPFGVFVAVPGLPEGLAHVSTLSGELTDEERYRAGAAVEVEVVACDLVKRRLSFREV